MVHLPRKVLKIVQSEGRTLVDLDSKEYALLRPAALAVNYKFSSTFRSAHADYVLRTNPGAS